MQNLRFRAYMLALAVPFIASCAGGSQSQAPSAKVQPAPNLPQTFNISGNSTATTLSIRSSFALPQSAVTQQTSSCPNIPPIKIVNPYDHPVSVVIQSFTVKVNCTASPAQLFGATFYQVIPQPQTIAPIKVGNAAISGSTLKFTAIVNAVTLASNSTSQITILPETTTSDVAFPVAPGSTTDLTSNDPSLPSGLTLQYQTATGGTTYSAACFNAFGANGLAPALQGVPLVGIPSFYCHIQTPNGTPITFGNVVTFAVVDPKPDRAIFEPDGTSQGFACTVASACNVPSFTVPTTYQNFIAGNVQDLRLCVPATESVDCNGVTGDPQSGSVTSVPPAGKFQLLVADDPTYAPGPQNGTPVPWDGVFRTAVTGPCAIDTERDSGTDVPPNYTDNGPSGVGPFAEFDVIPTGTGTCTMTVREDPRYITDYTDPSNPQPRSASLAVTIGP